jgi:hypothetical protein
MPEGIIKSKAERRLAQIEGEGGIHPYHSQRRHDEQLIETERPMRSNSHTRFLWFKCPGRLRLLRSRRTVPGAPAGCGDGYGVATGALGTVSPAVLRN